MSDAKQVARARLRLLIALAVAVVVTGCEDRVVGLEGYEASQDLARRLGSSDWGGAERIQESLPGAHEDFNTEFLDGCPFASRDGKSFFMASNRPGGLGGIDIWVSTRASVDDPWGRPENVGAPVNSEHNDFCPTLARDGHTFYFVSNRPGGFGGADIYITRFRPLDGFEEPHNLGAGVNSQADEASPFPLPERGAGPVLYFSSTRSGGFGEDVPGSSAGDSDIYRSSSNGGVFGSAELVPGVNSAYEDGHPNVRRDGLEIFFFSSRPGGLGLADIYAATRPRASDAWSSPINLGAAVNSAAAETRPSLAWNGRRLYFGSTRPGGEGSSDIYVTSRESLAGSGG